MRRLGVSAVVLGLMNYGTAVEAQAPSRDVVGYPNDYYDQFRPQSALDMVLRTPGFALDDGDQELRGFGAGGGNVLVDGARPSSKSSISEALSRIPAAQVERIDVVRNAATAEAQGQSLILNVVRVRGGASGTWSLELERNGNNVIYPRGEVSYARSIAGWETSVRARAYWEEFPFRGERVLRDAAGQLTSVVKTNLPSTLAEAYVAGEARRPFAAGDLTLNGRLGWYDYHFEQPGEVWLGRPATGGPDQALMSTLGRDRLSFEVGADYARDVSGWNWKLVSLASGQGDSEAQFDGRYLADGTRLTASTLAAETKAFEAIIRTTATPAEARALRPEVGGELAYNRLNSELDLAFDDGGGLTPIALPAANVVVEELRGEVFANLNWTLSRRWSFEAGLAAETSEISLRGDATGRQRFTFVKPSAAIAWRAQPRTLVRAGVRRTVGQLDFRDFAASADLNDQTANAGNPDLGPDQTTRWYGSVDWRGPGDTAVNLELFREHRSDVLEIILLPSGAPGLANAGDAVVTGAKFNFTVPLTPLLAGARLTGSGSVFDSEFDDPLTGAIRPLSEVYSPNIDLEFRHDPPGRPFAWGLTYKAINEGAIYFLDQIDEATTYGYFGGFIETTAVQPVRLRLALKNADVQRSKRKRSFFVEERSGPPLRIERRSTRKPAFISLTISGKF
ncbi:MAG: TonB-dependent receptor [Phenylobacterium sp.]|uniref:TonB-dependent receptor domain-containing protein n=1 Tax=Phenylobacterium sp. TaxID=1871053 RepID=UPI002719B974|nr:TonB-dependent receptor [Phenylobacterium sp.]MDO8902523.1 TonB-dependent receptor [Phenylobacterium sp.]